MATNITWNGVSYSIPAAGEVNWPSLSNFLIALGNAAANSTTLRQAIRVATTTPVTVSATTDCTVVVELGTPGAVAVNLPAGINGQMFFLVDGTGDASTNNLTITPNGAETINGAATLVLDHDRQAVLVQFVAADNDWKVLANVLYPGTITPADFVGILPTTKGGTGVSGSATFPTTGTVATVPASGVVKSNGTALSSGNVDLTSEVTGTLPIGNGGTGQTTANAALNALLPSQTGNSGKVLGTDATNTSWVAALTNPMTTRGDMIRAGASGVPERFAAVTDNRVVAGDGTDVVSKQIDDPAFFTTGAEVTQSLPGVVKSAGQLLGTNTDDSAATGYVGEEITGSGVYESIANNTWGDTAQITLTPGDWDVSGAVEFYTSSNPTVSQMYIGYGSASGTSSTGVGSPYRSLNRIAPTTDSQVTMGVITRRYSVSANTTVYLKARIFISGGNINGSGFLRARRVR